MNIIKLKNDKKCSTRMEMGKKKTKRKTTEEVVRHNRRRFQSHRCLRIQENNPRSGDTEKYSDDGKN